MSRDEHLAWAKERALEYLPGDPVGAEASMLSDLTKHPETVNHAGRMLAPMFYGKHNDPDEVRSWIQGFR